MKYWIAVALLVLALTGYGGDREPLDQPEAPEFNLTGRWVTMAIDCDSFSGDLPEPALAELDGQLEYEALQSPGVRIVQMGNDLEFTDLETRKYQKLGGNQAASCSSLPVSSPVFSPGHHCSNFPLSVPSRARVRACSMRCAPGFDHRIC